MQQHGAFQKSEKVGLPGNGGQLWRSTSDQLPHSPSHSGAAQSLLLGCPQVYSCLLRLQQLMTHHPAVNRPSSSILTSCHRKNCKPGQNQKVVQFKQDKTSAKWLMLTVTPNYTDTDMVLLLMWSTHCNQRDSIRTSWRTGRA